MEKRPTGDESNSHKDQKSGLTKALNELEVGAKKRSSVNIGIAKDPYKTVGKTIESEGLRARPSVLDLDWGAAQIESSRYNKR